MMIRTVFYNKYSYMNGILFTEIHLDKDSGDIVVGFIDIRHVIEYLKNNLNFKFDPDYSKPLVKDDIRSLNDYLNFVKSRMKQGEYILDDNELIYNTHQSIIIPGDLFNCDDIYTMNTFYPRFSL